MSFVSVGCDKDIEEYRNLARFFRVRSATIHSDLACKEVNTEAFFIWSEYQSEVRNSNHNEWRHITTSLDESCWLKSCIIGLTTWKGLRRRSELLVDGCGTRMQLRPSLKSNRNCTTRINVNIVLNEIEETMNKTWLAYQFTLHWSRTLAKWVVECHGHSTENGGSSVGSSVQRCPCSAKKGRKCQANALCQNVCKPLVNIINIRMNMDIIRIPIIWGRK